MTDHDRTDRRHDRRTVLATGLAAVLAASLLLAPTAAGDAATLPITEEQVELGAAEYAQHCAACHGARLEGMDHFPPIAGTIFQRRWTERTLGALYTYVHDTMPLGAGGSLSDEAYAAIVAYVLERNGIALGDVAFDPEDEAQAELLLAFGD